MIDGVCQRILPWWCARSEVRGRLDLNLRMLRTVLRLGFRSSIKLLQGDEIELGLYIKIREAREQCEQGRRGLQDNVGDNSKMTVHLLVESCPRLLTRAFRSSKRRRRFVIGRTKQDSLSSTCPLTYTRLIETHRFIFEPLSKSHWTIRYVHQISPQG